MAEQIPEIVKRVRENFKNGDTLKKSFREKQLKAILTFLKENRELIKEAVLEDYKKSTVELDIEIDFVINKLNYTLDNLDPWIKGSTIRKNSITQYTDNIRTVPQPYGTVLIISPWNYPIVLMFEPLFGAIAAGNCVVVKTSDMMPNFSTKMQEHLKDVLDSRYYTILQANAQDTEQVLLKQRFDYIFFTGSVPVGKIIMKAAAENLTPVTLELGGKCPVYVDSSCNLGYAGKRVAWGSIINAGQMCVSIDYVLAHASIYDELTKQIVQKWKAFTADKQQYSCIVNQRHFDRLTSLLESTNGKILNEVNNDPEKLLFEPVLVELTAQSFKDDSLMKDEIFGPILPIIRVESPEQAMQIINQFEKPLQIYLFTNKKNIQDAFLNHTESGGLTVNEVYAQMTVNELPFGGVGNSGMGSYHGHHTFKTFSHQKSVFLKGFRPSFIDDFILPPISPNVYKFLKKFI